MSYLFNVIFSKSPNRTQESFAQKKENIGLVFEIRYFFVNTLASGQEDPIYFRALVDLLDGTAMFGKCWMQRYILVAVLEDKI